jgi:hypothetical protein
MSTSIGAGGGAGNDGDGPKVSRVHVESHPVAKPEPTVTWPVKDGDVLLGTVKFSKGVYECTLPDGSIVEIFKSSQSNICTSAGDPSLRRSRRQGLSPMSTSCGASLRASGCSGCRTTPSGTALTR